MTRNSQSQYEFQRRLKASMDRHRRILNRLATSCPWDRYSADPEWDDVEEWFNTYKELLEREEEDSDK